jgi:cellobiose phosphorylase
VEPVIPGAWPGFQATRRFRGTTYEITVTRGEGSGTGDGPARIELVVDGRPVDGSLVPLPPTGTARVRVDVRLT